MFIASPEVIDTYLKAIPFGESVDLAKLRSDLATKFNADKTCPVTTGIYLRIVSEAAYEEFKSGKKITEITPFWRVVNPKMNLAQKLECGIEFILEQRKKEDLKLYE